MSIGDIFDKFDEEEEKKKATSKEAPESTQEPENEVTSIPEKEDKSKEEVEEAPASSEEEGVVDWFEPAEEEPAKVKPVEKQPIEEEAAEEAPAEEVPASEALAEAVDDWFEPAEEEPTRDKPAEDQPVEEEAAGETPAEETPATEVPAVVVDAWFEPAMEEKAPTEIPSKVGVDRGALIDVKASPIVVPAVTAEVMRESMRQFQNLKAGLLDKNTDIASIQNKPFIKRSGWRKLALAFNISDEIIKAEKEEKGDDFEWRIWVKVWAPNGRYATGVGCCSSKERDFSHLEHDVLATAHTRSKNRALSDLIGSGEVSWEELRGMG